MYHPRALESVLDDVADAPVTIVEGARASGKTTLVEQLVRRRRYRHYVTLADPTQFDAASADPVGWLASLPRPAVIDEAQLLDALPLAVKGLVDGWGPGEHFVLTGSASIGRTGLGGADPLVRRSTRHLLSPFTRAELVGAQTSVVDLLFDGDIAVGSMADLDVDLAQALRHGGFPSYALRPTPLSRRSLSNRVRSDVLSTVGDNVLPDERFDGTRALDVLDALLRQPGGILNASRLGDLLGMDRRTVDRYLDVLERRFLLHHLPNLATGGRQAPRSRAKIHAVDTAIVSDALLRAGRDLGTDRQALGGVLETHVVNQIVAARSWSTLDTRATYWRKAGRDAEVDLVLTDDAGRVVAVEVKAAARVSSRDLEGIRALHADRPVHRAFVFYTGHELIRLGENAWAVPVPALDHVDRLVPSTRSLPTSGTHPSGGHVNAPAQELPRVFVSYSHADDDYLGGAITAFARDVQRSYAFLYGDELQFFLDQDDLAWGEDWAGRLHEEIEKTAFLFAMVTPAYLRSPACRREFQQFDTAARAAGDQRLVLPLMWTEPQTLTGIDTHDPVLQAIRARQYDTSGVEIRTLEPGSREFRAAAEQVARRLRDVVVSREAAAPPATADPAQSHVGDEDRDLAELMDDVEALMPDLKRDADALGAALTAVGAAFSTAAPLAPGGATARAEQLRGLAALLEVPVGQLDEASASLGSRWDQIDSSLGGIARLTAELGDDGVRADAADSLDALAAGLEQLDLGQVRQMARMLGAFSRHLRPAARAMEAAVTVLDGVRTSVSTWRDALGPS